MNRINTEKTLLWVVKGCLYLLMFAPLLLSPAYFFPAIFPKAVYIRLLIELAIVAYVPLAVLAPRFRPRYHLAYGALALFALIVLLTSLTGENFSYSFWGNYERMDGVFSWLHYWAAIVMAASVLKEKREWLVLFSFSAAAALLMAGYGFLQRAGVAQFGPWTIYETNLNRITGTIGNPAFLAVYLLFNVTFALLIIIESSISRWWRAIVGVALAPIFWAYIMTGVRGAFIGFMVGTVIFFFGNLFWNQNPRAKRWITRGFFVLVTILAILYALVGKNQWVTENFRRYFSIPVQDSTVQTRLVSWRGALSGFKDNFWLGVGPQKFDVVFNQYFDPKFYLLVGDETWWDRAHNMILEVAVTMGILGLLAYLGVGLALVYCLRQMGQKQVRRRLEALVIVSFLVGYFIQNLFVFDTISSYIMLVALIGYIVAQTGPVETGTTMFKRFFGGAFSELRALWPRSVGQYWWVAGLVILGLMAPVAYAGNIKLIKQNRLLLLNLAYAPGQSFSKTVGNYKKIFSLSNFDNREVAIKLSQYAGSRAISGQMTLDELRSGYGFLMRAVDQVIAQNPKDVRLLLSYGNTLNVYAELLKQKDAEAAGRVLTKAENILRAAAALGRSRQQVFNSLANTYLIGGDAKRGIDTLLSTIAISPDTPTTYWLLSFAYLQANDKDNALQAANEALVKNYRFSNEREANPIAAVLAERGEYENLLRLYQKVVNDTGTGTAQAKVAAILAQMGKKEEARQAAAEVLRRDSTLKPQVDEFLKKLDSGVKDFISE